MYFEFWIRDGKRRDTQYAPKALLSQFLDVADGRTHYVAEASNIPLKLYGRRSMMTRVFAGGAAHECVIAGEQFPKIKGPDLTSKSAFFLASKIEKYWWLFQYTGDLHNDRRSFTGQITTVVAGMGTFWVEDELAAGFADWTRKQDRRSRQPEPDIYKRTQWVNPDLEPSKTPLMITRRKLGFQRAPVRADFL